MLYSFKKNAEFDFRVMPKLVLCGNYTYSFCVLVTSGNNKFFICLAIICISMVQIQ